MLRQWTKRKGNSSSCHVVRKLCVEVFEVVTHFAARFNRPSTSHCTQSGGVRRPLSQSCTVRTLNSGATLAAASRCESLPRASVKSLAKSIKLVLRPRQTDNFVVVCNSADIIVLVLNVGIAPSIQNYCLGPVLQCAANYTSVAQKSRKALTVIKGFLVNFLCNFHHSVVLYCFHFSRFLVSLFNSHRHQHYTATPYNMQQLF